MSKKSELINKESLIKMFGEYEKSAETKSAKIFWRRERLNMEKLRNALLEEMEQED